MQMLQRFCFFYSDSLYSMTEAHLDGISSRRSIKIQSLNERIDTLLRISCRLNVLSLAQLQRAEFKPWVCELIRGRLLLRDEPADLLKDATLAEHKGTLSFKVISRAHHRHARQRPDTFARETRYRCQINALRAEISQSDRFQCGNIATVLHRICCLMLQLCNFRAFLRITS